MHIPPPSYFYTHLLHLYSTFLKHTRTCFNPPLTFCVSFYCPHNPMVSLRYPIGIIEQGQMIKRPITINAGEIKNSSQLLLLSFSNVNQCPSLTHTHTHQPYQFNRLGLLRLFEEKVRHLRKRSEETPGGEGRRRGGGGGGGSAVSELR